MKAQESSAAATIVKKGERYVCEVLGLFSDALKELKREFHEEHTDMVRAVRDLAAEEIARQELIDIIIDPILRSIEKHWRYKGQRVEASITFHALTRAPGIQIRVPKTGARRVIYAVEAKHNRLVR